LPTEAAIYETFVVPRYMRFFGDLVLEMAAAGEDAQVVHLNARTGYPDHAMLAKLEAAHFYGVDASQFAVELARAKAQSLGMVAEYRVAENFPVPFPDGAFSHGYSLHPLVVPDERKRLFAELARLIAPSGQALVALPMRGSFIEVADLLREYALKNESTEVAKAVEAAVLLRPTPDELIEEMKAAGFDYVEIVHSSQTLTFDNGRAFAEDPVTRLMLLPEFGLNSDLEALEDTFAYVRDAIDKYWSDSIFTLTVDAGCVSGRRT
jgi:SAM-dependent methyltransferase